MPRILMIEDDPDTGDSIKAMLEISGHEVHWARHGREAMTLLQQEGRPDVILTDILMPEMDGIESILYIRKHHPGLVVVAMTAQRDAPFLRAAALFGAQATLFKPFSISELNQVLNKVLGIETPGPEA